MNTIQVILLIAITLLGFPIGKFIAKHTKEELKAGKNWFLSIIFVCVFGIIISIFLFNGTNLFFMISAFVFILLLALASLKK